jgi:hypothetical protein
MSRTLQLTYSCLKSVRATFFSGCETWSFYPKVRSKKYVEFICSICLYLNVRDWQVDGENYLKKRYNINSYSYQMIFGWLNRGVCYRDRRVRNVYAIVNLKNYHLGNWHVDHMIILKWITKHMTWIDCLGKGPNRVLFLYNTVETCKIWGCRSAVAEFQSSGMCGYVTGWVVPDVSKHYDP